MKYLIGLFWFLACLSSVSAKNGSGALNRYHFPTHQFVDREEKESFWKRVTFGGNVGLQLGNPINILVSPAIGYIPKGKLFKDKFMFGIGATYMYQKIKYAGIDYEANIYGGRTFARYLIYQNFFAYLEHEFLNTPVFVTNGRERRWVNSVFLGGGYLLKITQNGGVMISVLYNLAWTPVHPLYSSPWNIRIGFMI